MPDLPTHGDSERFVIDGPAGDLEVDVSMPDAAPAASAVVCHPHPQYGGSLDNKVAYTLARACRDTGIVVARLNFRGVGRSQGDFDEGRGETDDALSVADWLCTRLPERPFYWLGFSFGAGVALRAAMRRLPRGLVTVALPTRYFDTLPRPDCVWLAVQGDADEVVDPDAAQQSLRALQPVPDIEVLEGVGHFFHGHIGHLRERVGTYLQRWQSETG